MNLALFSVIAKIKIRKTSFQTSNYINSTFFTVLFFIGYKPPSGDLLMEKGGNYEAAIMHLDTVVHERFSL